MEITVKALNEAEKLYSSKGDSGKRAVMQVLLAMAYTQLAEDESPVENYSKAVDACKQAKILSSFNRDSRLHFQLNYYLGHAYWRLASNGDKNKRERLREAIAALKETLQFHESEYVNVGFFEDRYLLLGKAYLGLAQVEYPGANARNAIDALSIGFKVFSLKNYAAPDQSIVTEMWSLLTRASIQVSVGEAYNMLASNAQGDERNRNLKEAAKAYSESMQLRSTDTVFCAAMQAHLGDIYSQLAFLEDFAGNREKGLSAYKQALEVFTKEKFPTDLRILEDRIVKLEKISNLMFSKDSDDYLWKIAETDDEMKQLTCEGFELVAFIGEIQLLRKHK